ncbi:hypothetical protein CsSME_00018489 [Camellia sinensis var. sinensis]
MLTKFMLRPHSLPFSFLSAPFFSPNLPPLSKPLSLLTTTTAAAAAAAAAIDQSFSYGPSLHKGLKFPQHQHFQEEEQEVEDDDDDDDDLIDRESFARVYDVSALRVPSEHCFSLESRLRGHLLNWPRVRNIARVPGDEIEDDFKKFLKTNSGSESDDGEGESLVSLNWRIYGKAEGDGEKLSLVLYRDRLARTFNSLGFVKFRNLAKLSRPKKRKKGVGEERKRKGIVGKNEFSMVEVVEDEGDGDGEDLSGLLGDEFKGRRWKGSTRLLLLDERYGGESLDNLPEAIKVSVSTL